MIEQYAFTVCYYAKKRNTIVSWKGDAYSANFFSNNLNASLVNLKAYNCDNPPRNIQRLVQHKQRKFYKEITTEYNSLDGGHM